MSHLYGYETTADGVVRDLSEHIKNKVLLTTGVSLGSLGPGLLILAGRSLPKLQETAEALAVSYPAVRTRPLELDLGSLAIVRRSAAVVNDWDDVLRIDVLVNNAGILGVDFALTPDGYEITFATNHLGHFLFTNLIMGKLLAAKSARVVNVSSDGYRLNPIRWGDYDFHTANMLMAISLAEKLGPKRGLLAFSLHPGTVMTNLTGHLILNDGWLEVIRASDKVLGNVDGWKGYAWKTEQQGAATYVYAAFDPSIAEHSGAYLVDCKVADPWTETVRLWATSAVEAE
ncbi:uncharacterized protein BCR38DRAFT_464282 [Pseudomassariella vexata]|uniref:Short-chain dehydrogenase n=1 Tax=Pseudomassariella vexata TaxID=1141098 RepID=A0A1Y2EBX9_9PEZI|nr:uncharacterized protein BCR38DRAFT_464282 [Pseudomassariella vexata]ORY69068.1 hypothetical protein BCR38DRAFT_464282 [Pseudomassariella vexata]